MEWKVSGNALKTFGRSVTCLARIGNELILQASPSQIAYGVSLKDVLEHFRGGHRTIRVKCMKMNRILTKILLSAYQSIILKPSFFDTYTVTGSQVQCSVLLKAVCSVLRTPLTSIDHLSVILPDPDASKVQWTLECYHGMKKSYWITCNVEADVQQLSLDRRRLRSSFVVRPRDLNRLLANFQSTLQEITVIATEPALLPGDVADEVRGKAVELRSYIDPTKENDSSLHTQLWIDPSEEFVQYSHTGDPVDVTFGVKELKAFLAFCEGCEVDLHLYFDKAGEPILMAPKFSVEGVSVSNFDATLVLATMLVSQLQTEPIHAAAETEDQPPAGNVSEHPSDHTRIWSELSATKSASRLGGRVEVERDQNTNIHKDIQRISTMHVSKAVTDGRNFTTNIHQPMQTKYAGEPQGRAEISDRGVVSQRHLSNWVDADEDEDDDQGEDSEPYVQATPPYCEE